MNRRRFLATTALVPSTVVAGCLGTPDPDPDGAEFEYEVKQVGFLRSTRNPLGDDSVGRIDAVGSPEDAYETLPLEEMFEGDRRGSTEGFVDDTDFDVEFLLYVVTRWPKTNSAGIEVRELDREGETVVGTAAAVGDDPDEGDDAPTYPVALVRVFVGDGRPPSVELTVIDGSGNEATLEIEAP